jgi:hypothetical protein
MFKNFSTILGALSILFLFACGGNLVEEPLDRGYDYFPLSVGSYHVYQMDSVIYDPVIGGIEQQAVSLQVKEVVVDTFRDETNVLLYKTERYERPDENHDWEFKSVFAKGTDDDQAIYLTENLRFIKFIFPPRKYKKWNGNVHFDEFRIVEVAGEPLEIFKSWEYEITEEGEPLLQDPFEFDEVTTVTNANSENIIEYRYVIEKYARGIGLVYREMKILDTQCEECCNFDINFCETVPWEEKAEAGFILKQRLIDYN